MSHIGSNLSCLPVLIEIYEKKKEGDIVILDNGHAHLSHLVVKDEFEHDAMGIVSMDILETIRKHGIHCDRKAGCDASGGSLGHGLGIAIGYALANPMSTVYVIVSDGSMMEGSNWEAIRLIGDLGIKNIIIYTNFNGYSAVAKVDYYHLKNRMTQFLGRQIEFRQTDNTWKFDGVDGHYKKI